MRIGSANAAVLPVPGLGGADHVAAGEHERDGGLLDRRGLGVSRSRGRRAARPRKVGDHRKPWKETLAAGRNSPRAATVTEEWTSRRSRRWTALGERQPSGRTCGRQVTSGPAQPSCERRDPFTFFIDGAPPVRRVLPVVGCSNLLCQTCPPASTPSATRWAAPTCSSRTTAKARCSSTPASLARCAAGAGSCGGWNCDRPT